MRPNRILPPVVYCRGVNPSQAANWRPFLNCLGSPTLASSAVAVMAPMPGIVINRFAGSLSWTRWLSSRS